MWQMRRLFVTLLSVISCAPQSRIEDLYRADAIQTRIKEMRSAPIIFVGVVNEVTRSGEPRRASKVPSLRLQLYRAECRVEATIKGTVPNIVDLWYFGPAPEDGMVGFPKFWLQPGQRRIFFATKQRNNYRSIGDYLDYTEWVHSGKPAVTTIPQDIDAGHLIARILLTPGIGLNETEFAGSLVDAKMAAEAFSTAGITANLLTKLVSHPTERVRTEACRILVTHYARRLEQCSLVRP